jgi:hypothetical protein
VDHKAYLAALEVERAQAQAEHAAPPPAGLSDGLVSDFEDEKLTTRFGHGWAVSTDTLAGGSSKAALKVTNPGANKSHGALAVSGVVAAKPDGFPWAGAMFSPGEAPLKPANLASKKEISFYARGDGKTYNLLLFAKSRGYQPAVKTFEAKPEWHEYRFSVSDFDGLDGHDLTGIFFGAGSPGSFAFELDNVAFR